MSSKTKIVVLHMKEIIYTTVFVILGILLILLLVFMFAPWGKKDSVTEQKYTPGVYTSSLTLNSTALEVEVTVDESHINSIRFANLDETITTMYPLIQPTLERSLIRYMNNNLWIISSSQKTILIPHKSLLMQ